MKQLITLAAIMFIFATAAIAQSEKTMIKSIAASSAVAALELPGEVVVKHWDKDFIRITVTVSSNNSSEEILKKLMDFGRYDIIANNNNGQMTISLPKISNHVFFKGEQMNEVFKFEVQIPQGVETFNVEPAM
jgi:hypothetical protein